MVPSGASTELSIWIDGSRLGSKYISVEYNEDGGSRWMHNDGDDGRR